MRNKSIAIEKAMISQTNTLSNNSKIYKKEFVSIEF